MTLWGTRPALWTCGPIGGQPDPRAGSPDATVDNPDIPVDDNVGCDLGRWDVIHNPHPLLPPLKEFNSLKGKDPV